MGIKQLLALISLFFLIWVIYYSFKSIKLKNKENKKSLLLGFILLSISLLLITINSYFELKSMFNFYKSNPETELKYYKLTGEKLPNNFEEFKPYIRDYKPLITIFIGSLISTLTFSIWYFRYLYKTKACKKKNE